MKHSAEIRTIAVYDRWFFRMGGGERMVCALLNSLHRLGYEVTLISQIEIDLRKATHEFGIDLQFVQTQLVSDINEEQLGSISKNFDLFINASHMDIVPNSAKRGVLLPFFPAKPATTLKEKMKQGLIVPLLQRLFIYPKRLIGFTTDRELSSQSILTFSQQKLALVELVIAMPEFPASLIESIEFYCGEKKLLPVSVADVPNKRMLYQFKNQEFLRDRGIRIKIPEGISHEHVRLESINIPSLRFLGWKLFASLFPEASVRLTGGASLNFIQRIASYQEIWAISEYTKHWILKYWGKNSTVLFPPISANSFTASHNKANQIIHIGRFFSGGHSKKQLDLVMAFRQLVDAGLTGWELHFVGKPASEPVHQAYFSLVLAKSSGYPIRIHTDADTRKVSSLLSKAKIYWHATGYQEDLNSNPEAAEHFGLSTVEAMASGCVPVVYAAGGQKEIVSEHEGYTWKTIDELRLHTKRLIEDPKQLATLSSQAKVKAKSYDIAQFETTLQELLHNL